MKKVTFLFLAVFFVVCHQVSPQTKSRIFTQNAAELAEFFNKRGLEYFNKGEHDSAIEDFSRAIRLNRDEANFYNNRGNSYFSKGESDLAFADYLQGALVDPNNARSFVNLGNIYYTKGDLDRALENYTHAIQLDPDYVVAYYNSGNVYADKGDYDLAIENHTRAIQLNPRYLPAYYNRGVAYTAKGDHDSAITDYTLVLRLDPNNRFAYNSRGSEFNSLGYYDLAIEDLSQAIRLNQNYTAAYNNRGKAYSGNGDYDKAIEDFSRAIQLSPNNAEFYNNRGDAYYWMDEYDPAIEDHTHAIQLDPDNADFYSKRGRAYSDKGEYDPAIEDYNHAIRLGKNDPEVYTGRGTAYGSKSEYEPAIKDYTQAMLLDPEGVLAYVLRGILYSNKGEYDLAIEDLTHAILLNPNLAMPYNYRGKNYAIKGEFDKAIEDYTRAIGIDPNDPDCFNSRGYAYSEKSEYDLAIEDYTRAIRLDPNEAEYFSNRGSAYSEKNEYDKAIEDYTRAIRLDPTHSIYNNRGNAYSEKGEYDRAIEDYTQAILLDSNQTEYFNNRGAAYVGKGEDDRAAEDFTQAILLDPNNAWAYVHRGISLLHRGENDKAIEDFSQAILLDSSEPYFFSNRGLVYLNKDEYDRAIEDYTQAILLNPNLALVYSNRGVAYQKKEEHDLAIKDFTQAILIDPNFSWAYNNRGETYSNKGEYDKAVVDYEKALETAEIGANLNMVFSFSMIYTDDIYKEYPYLEIENEKPFTASYIALAMKAIARSVRRAEQIRSNMGTRGSAIMTQALYFYYMGLDLESHFGTPEKAFEYSESLRSRGFLDQLGTESALQLPGISTDERERLRYLLNEIENRQNVLAVFRERPPKTPEEERSFVNAGQTLSVLETELAALDTAISARIPQYAELRSPVPANLARAQDWLDKDTAVLIYALWDDSIDFVPLRDGNTVYDFVRPAVNSYCLVLTKDRLTAVTLDHEFNYMQSINRLRTNIMRRNRIGTMERDRNALYDALIKPALPHIPANIKNLIIVPDGTLGHLPFDILREDDDSPDLGETYRLSLSPSVSVSMLSEKSAAKNLPILAFGGAWYDREKTAVERGAQRSVSYGEESNEIAWHDLPGTEEEVQRLAQLVSSAKDIRVFMGSDVSEEHVKKLSADGELAKYPMLHFATHGYFKDYDLERAGIVLSEVSGLLDNGEDGYLTIPEIAVLNVNARLVLLSACETGLGVLRRGDGMVGMVRAFLLAGAEYLGVSLWEVNDEVTLEFMTLLYTKVLNEGMPFKEAYYLIKNEFRHHEEWDHPNYWAAFVLYE